MAKKKETTLVDRMQRGLKRLNKRPSIPKAPQRSSLAKVLEYARKYRKPCRYAVVVWAETKLPRLIGGKRVKPMKADYKRLESCHETIAAARAKVADYTALQKRTSPLPEGFGLLRWPSSTKIAIYDIRTGKRVPSKRAAK